MRVAYTLEQCWHRVPGGTAVAAVRVAASMPAAVELVGVAGRHHAPPALAFRPSIPVHQLSIGRPWLYESWLRLGRPRVERATGRVDICHSTTIIPAPSAASQVVTIHDLAFLHHPEHFTRRGNDVFRRSLAAVRRRADLVLCSSRATMADCVAAGIPEDRLRHVPLGVEIEPAEPRHIDTARLTYGLPERFALFVGTVEPRKNLARLAAAVQAMDEPIPLVVVGAAGWGDALAEHADDVHFVGFVDSVDLPSIYAAATVFCYPSVLEGFGLPVLEAMAQGTPVVTSRGTSTEEVAGGHAVLVDPLDVDSIAAGIEEALRRAGELGRAGREWAGRHSWTTTAEATAAAYAELSG